MATTKISPNYQVIIPKEGREKLHPKSGQKLTGVIKGGVVHLIPEKPCTCLKVF